MRPLQLIILCRESQDAICVVSPDISLDIVMLGNIFEQLMPIHHNIEIVEVLLKVLHSSLSDLGLELTVFHEPFSKLVLNVLILFPILVGDILL